MAHRCFVRMGAAVCDRGIPNLHGWHRSALIEKGTENTACSENGSRRFLDACCQEGHALVTVTSQFARLVAVTPKKGECVDTACS